MHKTATRPWFRFSLRTMLIVVTALCCWLAWESSVVQRRKAVMREFQATAAVHFTTADDMAKWWPANAPPMKIAKVPWVRRVLGDVAVQEIWYHQPPPEADLTRLKSTFPEARMHEVLPEPCHPGCFPRGTLVNTPQGTRRIESVQVGEALAAFLPSGEAVIAKVQSVFITDNRLWKIDTSAGSLLTTETQPLCLATHETRAAGKLIPGDEILHLHGNEIRPAQVLAVSPTGRTAKVFNLVLGNSELFAANGFLARSKPPLNIADGE